MKFRPGVTERLGWYVYVLIDPRDDRVFYVGKGRGNRCFAHVAAARKHDAVPDRERPTIERIRAIERSGGEVRIDVLRHGLEDERTAFEVEGACIDLVGLDELENAVVGHDAARGRGPVDVMDMLYGAKRIQILKKHKVLLIKINRNYRPGMTADEIYEATRRWWRVGEQRAAKCDYAFAVFRSVVVGVWKIDRWEDPSAAQVKNDPRRKGRMGFVGSLDVELENRYKGRDVTRYLGPLGSQNPIRYVDG